MSDHPDRPDFPGHDPEPRQPRERHDAFNARKKCAFVQALMETGCVTEAADRAGVSTSTVYRQQEDDRAFYRDCIDALEMASTPLELTAWRRAVVGVEQEFACGGQVHVRRRYDGSLLRLLLQGFEPEEVRPPPRLQAQAHP